MSFTAAQKGKGRAIPAPEPTITAAINSKLQPDSSSESESPSDSDEVTSDSSSSSPSDSENESDSSISSPYMKDLLEKARQKAREKKKLAVLPSGEEMEEEVIRLDNDPEPEKLPPLDIGSLPAPYITPGDSRQAGLSKIRDPEVERTEKLSSKLSVPSAPAPPPDTLTKKQRQAMKNKTAGPSWFDLPAPAEADLPRLYREVEALRLRNQLDPKRFYRKEEGEGKGIKGLPKHFAIGRIIETKNPFGGASGENLSRSNRKRTLVDELVDDAEAKSYAKKKFKDLQSVRGARGRGTLAQKFAARKHKW